jgi:hypothetical protein
MSRRNQAKRRRNYGRRQHEVRERRGPDAPEDGDSLTREDAWGQWTTSDVGDEQRATDDGSYGSYAR